MIESLQDGRDLKQCPLCRKMVLELFELTAEDIQRTKDPDILVCTECKERLRAAAMLKVSYSNATAFRDFSITVPVALVGTILLADIILTARASSNLDPKGVLYFMTAVVLFTGASQIWKGLRSRYGFTHDLAWAIHSRSFIIGLGIVASCVIILALSFTVTLAGKL